MLYVVTLGRGLSLEFTAYVVRHLTVLLALLRAVMLILVALIVDTGEYEDVQHEKAAAYRYRHAQGRRVRGETVLRLTCRLLEG